jgi:hypothetical protein
MTNQLIDIDALLRRASQPTPVSYEDRFYSHNGPGRASFALSHDKRSGLVVLSLAFATSRKGSNGRPVDVYSKRVARERLDGQITAWHNEARRRLEPPRQSFDLNTFFIGAYDGFHSKNDLFGPLMDTFNELLTEGRCIDEIRQEMASVAASLLHMANYQLAKDERKLIAEVDALIGDLERACNYILGADMAREDSEPKLIEHDPARRMLTTSINPARSATLED